jgi:hypothetical protein
MHIEDDKTKKVALLCIGLPSEVIWRLALSWCRLERKRI